MRSRTGGDPQIAGTNSAFPDYFWFEYMGSEMPAWLEILIDMIGFAGFVGLAIYHKPKKNDEPIR